MARKPTPADDDFSLKLIVDCLSSGPKTAQEIADITTLGRSTVGNKLRKARNTFALPGTSNRMALISSVEIGPGFILYAKNPLFSTKPDNSIPANEINRYALCVVALHKANIEGMIDTLKDLYDKQRWEGQ